MNSIAKIRKHWWTIAQADVSPVKQAANDFPFFPTVVDQWQSGHRQLNQLIDEIALAVEAGDYAIVPAKLLALRCALDEYGGLQLVPPYASSGQGKTGNFVEIEREADLPGQIVHGQIEECVHLGERLISRYESVPLDAQNGTIFLLELSLLEDLLAEQKCREEVCLFKLYANFI